MWSASGNMDYFPSAVPDSPPVDTNKPSNNTTSGGGAESSASGLVKSKNAPDKPLTGEQSAAESKGVTLSFGSANEHAPLLSLQLLHSGQNGFDIDGYAALVRESKSILQTFTDFILDVGQLLEKECLSKFEKIRTSLLYLESSNTVDQAQLEPCHFFSTSSEIAEAKTFAELLAGLRQCSSWFNYDTIAYIAKRFGGIEGIKLVEGYELALTDYLQKLMIHCPPFLASPLPPVEFESLDTKVDWDIQGCVLQDIAIFKNTLCRVLKLDPAALVLRSVDSERCMLSWAIPNSTIKHTISYARSNGDALAKESVLAVRVGAKTLDISPKKATPASAASPAKPPSAQSPLTRMAQDLKQDLAQSPSRINGSYFQFYYTDGGGTVEQRRHSPHANGARRTFVQQHASARAMVGGRRNDREAAAIPDEQRALGSNMLDEHERRDALPNTHDTALEEGGKGTAKLDRQNKALSHSFSHVPRQKALPVGSASSSQKITPRKFIFPAPQSTLQSSDRIKSLHLFHSNSIDIGTCRAPNIVTLPQSSMNEKPPLKVSMSEDTLRHNGVVRGYEKNEKIKDAKPMNALQSSKNVEEEDEAKMLHHQQNVTGMQTDTNRSKYQGENIDNTKPQPNPSSALVHSEVKSTADASKPTQDAKAHENQVEGQRNGIHNINANRMLNGDHTTSLSIEAAGGLTARAQKQERLAAPLPYVPRPQNPCLPKTSVGFLWRVLGRASAAFPAGIQVALIQNTEVYFEGDIALKKGQKLKALYRECERIFVETPCGQRGFVPYSSCRVSRKFYGPKSTILKLSYLQLYLATPDSVEKRESMKRERLSDVPIEMVAIEEQTGSSTDELSVKCGEKVRALYCDDTWVFAVADAKRTGIIPRVSCRMTKLSQKTFEKWIEESGLFQCDYIYKYSETQPAILCMSHLAVSPTTLPIAAQTVATFHSKIGKIMTIIRSFVPTTSDGNLLTIRKGLRVMVQDECDDLLRVATKSGTSFWIPANYVRPGFKNTGVDSFLNTSTEAISEDDDTLLPPHLCSGATNGTTAISPVVSTPQNLYEAITNDVPSLKRRLNSSYEKLVNLHSDFNGLSSTQSEPELSVMSSNSLLAEPVSADSLQLPYPPLSDLDGEIIC